ncbi:MAG: hypothetical protein JXA18_02325 [Chitinispirillaceae bacterium]|nr:hypothetical protein [Chitinispirillaceae bacterium]
MYRRLSVVIAFTAMVLLCGRESDQKWNEPLASAGFMRITRLDAEVFSAVAGFTPFSNDSFRLIDRDQVSGLLETEAIYRKVRWNLVFFFMRYSRQWRWKQRYFVAMMYSGEILQKKLGYTDAELRRYYATHKEEFRREGDAGSAKERDVLPFDSVWFGAARKLFLSEYQHDSGSSDLHNSGVFYRFFTDGYKEYFMKKFYSEKYGKPFPRSVDATGGIKGFINEKDVQSALPLLAPQERIAFEKDPLPFVHSLAQWKLFSEKAVASGYTARFEVRKALKWAFKIEAAQRYIKNQMLPLIKQSMRIDTSLAELSYYDEAASAGAVIDTGAWKAHLATIKQEQMAMTYDSLIVPLRRNLQVRFLQSDWSDEKGGDPVLLLKRADSLRDRGGESDAYDAYAVLAANYAFTPQGSRALLELAAMQAERDGYCDEAIKNYRRYLLKARDPQEQCTAVSAIGFIYDRYLGRLDLAELQYRWVLKHAPECPRAADAEFMLLHLGEPFPGSRELQAEALRQGRK